MLDVYSWDKLFDDGPPKLRPTSYFKGLCKYRTAAFVYTVTFNVSSYHQINLVAQLWKMNLAREIQPFELYFHFYCRVLSVRSQDNNMYLKQNLRNPRVFADQVWKRRHVDCNQTKSYVSLLSKPKFTRHLKNLEKQKFEGVSITRCIQ